MLSHEYCIVLNNTYFKKTSQTGAAVSEWVIHVPLMFYILLYWTVFVAEFFLHFFCYVVIVFVNNKQNILIWFKLNPPLCDKKKAGEKKSFDPFLIYLYNWYFLVFELLYESTQGHNKATQGPTDGLDDATITAEIKYSINITKSKMKICLNLHYNQSNANRVKIYQE